uniref:8.9 kDa family member n=1 Tax=Rhipicephalus zambeziensis TaxID=60191 RepID=A0A224YAN6_9ACAR
MSLSTMSMTSMCVVISLLTHLLSSASDADSTKIANTTEAPTSTVMTNATRISNTTEGPTSTVVTNATKIPETTETPESSEYTDDSYLPITPYKLRLNCSYNGTEYQHGYTDGTNPECIFYWCNNGTMETYNCPNGPPRQYGSCICKRRAASYPTCCRYECAC